MNCPHRSVVCTSYAVRFSNCLNIDSGFVHLLSLPRCKTAAGENEGSETKDTVHGFELNFQSAQVLFDSNVFCRVCLLVLLTQGKHAGNST